MKPESGCFLYVPLRLLAIGFQLLKNWIWIGQVNDLPKYQAPFSIFDMGLKFCVATTLHSKITGALAVAGDGAQFLKTCLFSALSSCYRPRNVLSERTGRG
ncbi:hypothetical protein [Granulicella mallensis]|uniref:hypothetical protein n=1 Tax=Granulicella mallensis TaxID=940614 RepID=UPI0012377328|nr:hypothetical protein [Granulicella mallensis]